MKFSSCVILLIAFQFPFNYALSAQADLDSLLPSDSVLVTKAEFKKGQAKLYSFISKKIKVPGSVYEKYEHYSATVYVSFVVEKNGSVRIVEIDPRTNRKIDKEFKTAAINVVKKTSRKWIPATQRGKPVRMRFSIPIKYKW